MFKNYFLLIRQSLEIQSELNNSHLIEAFSQEKDRLLLKFEIPNQSELFLELNCSNKFSSQWLRDRYSKAKKNVLLFFEDILPQKFVSIDVALYDRILRYRFENSSLFFMIHGARSNVIFLQNDQTYFFKHSNIEQSEKETILSSLQTTVFKPATDLKSFFISELESESIQISSPSIGKEIRQEFEERKKQNNRDNNSTALFREILREVFESKLDIITDPKSKLLTILPATFLIKNNDSLISSDSYNFIQKEYIILSQKQERFLSKKNQIINRIDKQIKYIASKLDHMKQYQDSESEEKKYVLYANLIQTYIHLIKKSDERIILPDFNDENISHTIGLKSELSPSQNAELYYKKARSIKIRRNEMEKMVPILNENLRKLTIYRELLENIFTENDLDTIINQTGLKMESQENRNDDLTPKFRCYTIENKYKVYIGKEAKNNDFLTFRFAKNEDYWFHARSVPGSHVVLKSSTPKEPVPKNILKLAASLAAYYSKAKNAGLVPVSFTQRKYVVKKKGMDPGQVALLKESVLLVQAEIPAACSTE